MDTPPAAGESAAQLRWTPDIRRLYIYRIFNAIALAVVANMLFTDKLLLRMGLDLSQFGLVKGIAMLVPAILTLFISPWLVRLNRDRELVGYGYVLRVSIPYLFLALPFLTEDKTLLTVGCTAVLLVSMVFPTVANNSILVLYKEHLPPEEMGRHNGRLTALQTVSLSAAAIACGWFLDRYETAPDNEFYFAFLIVMAATTVFQIPAAWVILRLTRKRGDEPEAKPKDSSDLKEMLLPFCDRQFQPVLVLHFATFACLTMVAHFMNPYLLQIQKLSMAQVSTISTALAFSGMVLLPRWGKWLDRFGGKNVYRYTVLGSALGIFALAGTGWAPILIFAALIWDGMRGIFGTGRWSAQQYLLLSQSREDKANIYLAASSLVMGAGMFVGSALGGYLLRWIELRISPEFPGAHYKIYFVFCGLAHLLLSQFVAAVQEERRHVSGLELAGAIMRSAWYRFSRLW